MTGVRADVLITPAELADRLDSGDGITVLDVRWELSTPDGHASYADGHIPGAVYVSLEDDLTDHAVTGRGRHPLPSGRAVEVAARRWGIRRDTPVVVYDDWARAGSSRAWWVLTAAGVPDVRILDGGLRAWVAAGGALETGPVEPEAGDVAVRHADLYAGALATLSADDAAAIETLVDARAPERFRGEVEPVDAVAGHIPGALNLPVALLLDEHGAFLGEGDLTRLFAEHGVHHGAGAYCGSGVTAAIVVAALASTGVPAALYPGSWSEWSSDPSRPVARGTH